MAETAAHGRRRRLVLATLLAVALTAVAAPGLAQCAMCRGALESPEAAALAKAFSQGILVLLAVPLTAVGLIAMLFVRERRKVASLQSPGERRRLGLPPASG